MSIERVLEGITGGFKRRIYLLQILDRQGFLKGILIFWQVVQDRLMSAKGTTASLLWIAKYSCNDCDGDEAFVEGFSDLFTFDDRDEDYSLELTIEKGLGLSSATFKIDDQGNITRELYQTLAFYNEVDD